MGDRDGNEGGKRSHDDRSGNQNKRARGDYNDMIVFRLLIPSSAAGGIIGMKGETIKKLRADYDAKINIPDCNGPERVIKISTNQLNNALDCIAEIIPCIEKKRERRGGGGRDYDDKKKSKQFIRMMVHQSIAGAIIGRGGAKIKELRESTGTDIKVFKEVCPGSSDRVVQIAGEPETIRDAVEKVHEICADTPPKGVVQDYDPFCFDADNAEKYGGYGNEEDGDYGGGRGGGRGFGGGRGGGRDGGFQGGRGGGRDRRGGGGGRGGRGGRDGGRDNRDRGFGGFDRGFGGGNDDGFGRSPYANQGGMDGGQGGFGGRGGRGGGGGGGGFGQMGGGNFGGGGGGGFGGGQQYDQGFGGNQGGFGGDFNQGGFGGGAGGGGAGGGGYGGGAGGGGGFNSGGAGVGDNSTTQQVTIPTNLAGSIIGKGGERIREIRQKSQADIKIADPAAGSKDRIITITGTENAISHAKFLLQSSVKEYQARQGGR